MNGTRLHFLCTHAALGAALVASTLTGACGDEADGTDDPAADGGSDSGDDDDDDDVVEDGDDDDDDDTAPTAVGRCEYASPFTMATECREWTGAAWTEDDVEAACSQLMGEATMGQACSTENMLGRCVLDGGTDNESRIVTYGDASGCDDQILGCETFGGGSWQPAEVCDGAGDDDDDDDDDGPTPFIQPTRDCVDPLAGEPEGQSPGGEVCTWQAISGATEEGRQFADYGDCDTVYTQRPYYPVPGNESEPVDDPRLNDTDYVAELAWVRDQVAATACVCCHGDVAPNGPSMWDIDAPGNWVNTFYDQGIAFSAGWIDSTSFGMYPPEENNGFDRSYGIPSTDPERMRAFFVAEAEHRGLSEQDFEDTPPFGGPLWTQRIYEPEACENGEGVDQDGTINWTGGPARYVYVLEAGSENPTVPPNLDLPEGTLWRVDVPYDGDPVASGDVRYGEVPSGTAQKQPEQGPPQSLVPGEDYYVYVTKDVIQPVTRCIFTY